MMEAKRQSNMTAVQAYTTGCKNSPGYGGKDSTFFRSWGRKKREKSWGSDKSHHKYSIAKIISEQELGLRSGSISDIPPKDGDDELSICIGTVYCAEEICKQNTNECQGNALELESCPNQHKRVTTLSSEYSSSSIYILHFRHLADTLNRSDWMQQ